MGSEEMKLLQKAAAAWATMDKDGDGKVTYTEFSDAMKKGLGQSYSKFESKMKPLYEVMVKGYADLDTNGDGRVSCIELMEYVKSQMVSCDKLSAGAAGAAEAAYRAAAEAEAAAKMQLMQMEQKMQAMRMQMQMQK